MSYAHDRPLASVAARDIAEIAARLLTDRSWAGQENLPLFGPDRLTPDEMEQTMSDVLGRPVAYRQTRGGLRRKHGLTWPDVGADEQTIPE